MTTVTGLVVTITPAAAACSITVNAYANPTNRSNSINNGGCGSVGAAHSWAQPCNGCRGVTGWVFHPTSAWSPTQAYLLQGLSGGG